ncbi:MAG: high-potential iron-sulfur protein [Burkholderiaceae bacterium]
MTMNRRTFVIQSLLGTASLAVAATSRAADGPKVSESDPQAVALGYKDDATKADTSKFPKYAAGQRCGNCQLYQGPPTGAGACALFAGKTVPARAWCSAYVKKA